MVSVPKPDDYAPPHQLMLALAMKVIDAEDEGRLLRQAGTRSRMPAKWQAIHSGVDRANAALAKAN